MRPLPQNAAHSYERWRQQFLDGHNSSAIYILRRQGLYRALVAVTPVTADKTTLKPSPQWVQVEQVTPSDALLVEAARQIQRLLQSELTAPCAT